MARTATAKTLVNRTRGVGEKTGIPRIDELSPTAICATVQDQGYWFLSWKVIERLYVEACEASGIKPNADFEGVILPLMVSRVSAGVNQRAAKGDVADGMRYATSKKARRGAHVGMGVTMVPIASDN